VVTASLVFIRSYVAIKNTLRRFRKLVLGSGYNDVVPKKENNWRGILESPKFFLDLLSNWVNNLYGHLMVWREISRILKYGV
jgi:hypothetical protein